MDIKTSFFTTFLFCKRKRTDQNIRTVKRRPCPLHKNRSKGLAEANPDHFHRVTKGDYLFDMVLSEGLAQKTASASPLAAAEVSTTTAKSASSVHSTPEDMVHSKVLGSVHWTVGGRVPQLGYMGAPRA